MNEDTEPHEHRGHAKLVRAVQGLVHKRAHCVPQGLNALLDAFFSTACNEGEAAGKSKEEVFSLLDEMFREFRALWSESWDDLDLSERKPPAS